VPLTREEVAALLAGLDALPTREPYGLTARLLYGAGLRLMECCRLQGLRNHPGLRFLAARTQLHSPFLYPLLS
jgi:site-specific recombinase XerD